MFFSLSYLFFLFGVTVAAMISIADPSLIDIDELTESSLSAGKKAICTTRNVKVTVTSTNTKLRLPEPDSQMSATETVQELIQANATIIARLSEGKQTFTDTYSIGSKLCYPVNDSAHKSRTVQVLTHGMGLDKSYWDIAPGYSYVDAAAAAGYATLSYDRLGVGLSDHPDPIQVVQSHVDLEVLHALVQLLRSGELTAQTFKTVISVGHSYGSIIKIGVAAKYPKDFDAIITTGFAPEIQELGYTMVANNPTIAKLDQPTQFGHLSSGYLVHNSAQSIRLPFYRYPYYDLDGNFLPSCPISPSLLANLFRSLQLASRSQTNIRAWPTFHDLRYIAASDEIHRSCQCCFGPVRFPILQR